MNASFFAKSNTESAKKEDADGSGTSSLINTIYLSSHNKAITCLCLEPKSQHRLLSGSRDGSIAMWDFGSLQRTNANTVTPSRVLDPSEGAPLSSIKYTPDGQYFLACTPASPQVLLFDKDCRYQGDFCFGDQYLHDLRKTKGHVAAINGIHCFPPIHNTGNSSKHYSHTLTTGSNLPSEASYSRELYCSKPGDHGSQVHFVTWAADGTVRWWNIHNRKSNVAVLSIRGHPNPTTRPNILSVALIAPISKANNKNDAGVDGEEWLCAAGADGLIRIFSARGPWTNTPRATLTFEPCEQCTLLAVQGALLARTPTRIYRWPSVATNSKPLVKELKGASCTDLIVFREELLLLTIDGPDTLVLLDASSLEVQSRYTPFELNSGKVITVLAVAPFKLQQVFLGCKDGTLAALYKPGVSQKGVTFAVQKPLAKTTSTMTASSFKSVAETDIILPFAPQDTTFNPVDEKALAKAAQLKRDPSLAHRPDLPIYGVGHGGRLGTSLTQTIMQSIKEVKDPRSEDPREALLKFAEAAESNPLYVTPAYAQTQPKTIFDEHDELTTATPDFNDPESNPTDSVNQKRTFNEEQEEALRQAIKKRLKPGASVMP